MNPQDVDKDEVADTARFFAQAREKRVVYQQACAIDRTKIAEQRANIGDSVMESAIADHQAYLKANQSDTVPPTPNQNDN
tara:strand:- start:205 stop:444 length:240 start_codon:yes stop_codon:yes gene_type:complete